MLVLMPDAQFEDDGEIEREVLGDLADVAVHHELVAERIAGEDWARADALIVYYGVPIDRAWSSAWTAAASWCGPASATTTSTSPRARHGAFRCATCRTTAPPRSPITRSR